ncbi:MAG: hypothetical protein ACYTAN_00605 [Planctomycetota bacterium]|jgi:hypothetical protein
MEERVVPIAGDQKRLGRLFWTFATIGLLFFAFVTIPPGARRCRALGADLDRAQSLRDGLILKRDALLQCERALKSDPFFNEAMLRDKMKYRKSGEVEVRTAAEPAPLFAVAGLRVPDFMPSPPTAKTLRAHIADWSLLFSSALLVATAFLFFDKPASRPLRRLSLPPRG